MEVGDARVSAPDPRAARNAGTRYVHGLALPWSGKAFHPKVTVLAGPERALVGVGSGNLSPGGWHLNHETWTFATADQERCPVLVTEVAAWLRTLDEVCAVAPQAALGIDRTARWLERLAGGAQVVATGHYLVHTSTAALIDQLPDGLVQHLLLYAPFHDEHAAAVRKLVERLRPRRVTLAVQAGQTVIQPDALRTVIDDLRVPFAVVTDTSERYRHGKLIEAVGADGGRWTLTGSPNLSASALLRSARAGGNIEVGIVARPDVSLFPSPTELTTLDRVPAVRIAGGTADRALTRVTLLSAVRVEGGLELVFARPAPESLLVEASTAADFDLWATIGTVPFAAVSHLLPDADLPGGSRVRCTGADGAPTSVVFVTDPALVQIRPGEHSGRGRANSGDPVGLISDPQLLQRWLTALNELDRSPDDVPARRAAPTAPGGNSDHGPHPGPAGNSSEDLGRSPRRARVDHRGR